MSTRREESARKKDVKQLLRTLDRGLKTLHPEDLLPRTPCIDSWALASYVTGRLDEEAQRKVNSHIAFCDSCFEEFVALAGPEKIASILRGQGSLDSAPHDAVDTKRAEVDRGKAIEEIAEAAGSTELRREGVSFCNAVFGATSLLMFPLLLENKGIRSIIREVSV